MDMTKLLQTLQEQGMRLLAGLIVLAAGLALAHWIMKLICRGTAWNRMEPTARGFLGSLLRAAVYAVAILTAAGVMGIPLTAFVTLMASAGVAISLAAQGALGNLVGGMTILLLRLMKVGEYVKIGEVDGTVRRIGVMYTELVTPDNRHITLPNSSLTNAAIVNYTREGTRRLDVNFTVSYSADVDRVRSTLLEVVGKTNAPLPDPAPQVLMAACLDSSVQFTIRLWCRNEDYWPTLYFLTEEGKRALDAAGIEIPFPQMDVHLR